MKMQLRFVINLAASKFFSFYLLVEYLHWKPIIHNDINLIEKDCFAKRIFFLTWGIEDR